MRKPVLRLNKAHYFMGLPQKCTSTDKYFIDAIGETHNYAVGTGYGAVASSHGTVKS